MSATKKGGPLLFNRERRSEARPEANCLGAPKEIPTIAQIDTATEVGPTVHLVLDYAVRPSISTSVSVAQGTKHWRSSVPQKLPAAAKCLRSSLPPKCQLKTNMQFYQERGFFFFQKTNKTQTKKNTWHLGAVYI